MIASGVGAPDERLGVLVVGREEVADGFLQSDDGGEHAALELALGELGEHGLDGMEPGAGCRGEVEDPARVPDQPAPHLGMLVGGIVVEDHMGHLAGRHGALDRVEEAQELLVAVALHGAAEHRAVEDVARGEQVVMPLRT